MKILTKQKLAKAVKTIKQGGVVVCPTDTVYGLVCDATNKKAVDKLFKIKQRPKNKPVPMFVRNITSAKKLAEIDREQEKFLRKVWPGKTTVVLKSKVQSSKFKTNPKTKIYGINKNAIALRIPKHKVISYLLSVIGSPLTGTSANISGQPAFGNIKEVVKQFENKKYQPDLVLDFGNLSESKPSKIIDLTAKPYKLLRK